MVLDPLFSYEDYKTYLNDQIAQNEEVRGYKSLLADAAKCQRSFMSQVLNGPVHLTPDHAVGLTEFWKMDADATEYFVELVNYGRAATPTLRSHLDRRMKAIRKRQQDSLVRMNRPELENVEHQSIYYSHWYWTALHMLVGIKGFQTEKSLAERLHLPVEMIKQALGVLQKMGLVVKGKNGWEPSDKSLHAAAGTIHSWLHHDSWRAKSSEDIRKKNPDSFHFSGIYTLSTKDKAKIHDMILELTAKTEKIVGPSTEEEAVCFLIDWFDV